MASSKRVQPLNFCAKTLAKALAGVGTLRQVLAAMLLSDLRPSHFTNCFRCETPLDPRLHKVFPQGRLVCSNRSCKLNRTILVVIAPPKSNIIQCEISSCEPISEDGSRCRRKLILLAFARVALLSSSCNGPEEAFLLTRRVRIIVCFNGCYGVHLDSRHEGCLPFCVAGVASK